jgi:hypothetical protein
MGFVEGSQGSEASGGGRVAAHAEVDVTEDFAEVREVRRWETVL